MSPPMRVLAVLVMAATAACGGGGRAAGDPTEATWQRLDGSNVAFGALDDKPTVVNFFASWCTPCLLEMPAFEAAHKALGDRVSFLGLNLQEDAGRAGKVVAATGVTYTVGLDQRGDVYRVVGANTMPATALLDASGRVVTTHGGALTEDDLLTLVRTKLGVS